MMLLRRVIGDALRGRRQGQQRTLREVSTAANVSLGYLSEIERGQKEASSELLASICDALGAQLSEVLREASDTMAFAEQLDSIGRTPNPPAPAAPREPEVPKARTTDGDVPAPSVRHEAPLRTSPLRTTLKAARNRRPGTDRPYATV
jgi:transcriptional regulator with XRE-family HTH domain